MGLQYAPGSYITFSFGWASCFSLPSFHVRICMGTLPRLDLMRQYPVKITNIQVDVTFIIPKLIDGVPSHAKGAYRLK